MTDLDKRLNDLIRREGLTDSIKENVKYFKEKLPLSIERKAFFVKDALLMKYRRTDWRYAYRICDEINASLGRKPGMGKKIYNSTSDFIGKQYGVFKVVEVVDNNPLVHSAHVIIECVSCGARKQRLLRGIRVSTNGLSYCKQCGAKTETFKE